MSLEQELRGNSPIPSKDSFINFELNQQNHGKKILKNIFIFFIFFFIIKFLFFSSFYHLLLLHLISNCTVYNTLYVEYIQYCSIQHYKMVKWLPSRHIVQTIKHKFYAEKNIEFLYLQTLYA